MQGYSGMQQQYGAGPMAPQAMYGVPPGAPGHGPPAGVPTAVVPQRGMYQHQPIRLARFPGSELHAPPPGHIGGPPQMYGPLGQVPLSRTGSAGGAARPPAGPPSGYGTGPPLQGMQPFQPMLLPRQMSVGLPLQPGYMGPPPQGAYQQHLGMPLGLYGPPQAPPALRVGSGATTPSAQAGSGANTPMHPLQRGLSGGGAQMLMLAPGGPPGSGYATPHLAPQLLQGAVPLMQPPPGIVLPDTLSPPAPGSLRGTGSGSRMPSAAQSGHARAGSYGSGLMEPFTMQVQAPLQARTTLARTNSVGSIAGANSLRSSLEFGGVAGGLLGGGVSPPRRTGSSSLPKAPSFNSRAGSAGRRSVGAAAAGGAQPALDEYDNIKVAVRVRPPNAQELARGDAQALFVNPVDHRQVQLVVPAGYSRNGTSAARNFTFHACLSPASRQQDVLRLCGITQLLDAALDGYNATILAYGQTGSGKTFTMSGREDALMDEGYLGDSDDGIITRSLMYLFEQLAARGGAAAGDGCRYSLRVSFAEIYNEQIYDLIRFDRRQLAVRWDTAKGFHVPELLCKECSSLEETLQVLSLAVRHRRVGSHEMNTESSRSHSIFTVHIDATPTRPDDHEYGMTRYGKVSFVDLAGSERLRDSKSVGETLRETTNINRSLFMLGKVIAALADGAQGARVPYRESKLTKLLQDSLGGSSLSLLIACCSPSAAHVEETLSTLSYAARAKNIRNQPAVQTDPEQAAMSGLRREVKLLRAENAYLREQLSQASLPREQPPGTAGQAVLPASLPASRLPSSHGQPPAGGHSAAAAALAVTAGSRPASGGAVAGGSVGGGPSSEELMRRLLDTQRMLVQFSRENDRLAGENGRLRSGKTAVANDYKGALDEVDWLRTKLEALEAALLSGSLDSGLLAALDGGGGGVPGASSAADVLEAARAAVAGAGGEGDAAGASLGLGLRQPVLMGPDTPAGAASDSCPVSLASGSGPSPGSLEPLASRLAAAAESATCVANQALAEAAAAAAMLAAADEAESVTKVASDTPTPDPAVPAALVAGLPEEERLQEAGLSELKAGRSPLIDPHLVANPSELEAEGPIAATASNSVWSAAAADVEPPEGAVSGEAATAAGEPLMVHLPLPRVPQAALTVGRSPSAEASKLANSADSSGLPAGN